MSSGLGRGAGGRPSFSQIEVFQLVISEPLLRWDFAMLDYTQSEWLNWLLWKLAKRRQLLPWFEASDIVVVIEVTQNTYIYTRGTIGPHASKWIHISRTLFVHWVILIYIYNHWNHMQATPANILMSALRTGFPGIQTLSDLSLKKGKQYTVRAFILPKTIVQG